MKFRALIKDFVADESGVSSVEVAAFGAVIFFGSIAVMAVYESGVEELQADRDYQLEQQQKITTF